MSQEIRNSSATSKRADQLRRWNESETNRVSSQPKNKRRKVKFGDGCVFLASCAAGDVEEVKDLLDRAVDVNTANVDGLTALHQACIDNNLDMVEFLLAAGADVDKEDNEGWTPLHAAASLGFMSIASFLLTQGADVAAVNNDGELAIDISESDEIEAMLKEEIDKKHIVCEDARNREEQAMLSDAKYWYNSGIFEDEPHYKTGATALHVAAAKGFIEVMNLLVKCGAAVNEQDHDGWTPLHAAAHWGEKEACEVLVNNHADMSIKNYVGQTPADVADQITLNVLEELSKKQTMLSSEKNDDTVNLVNSRNSPNAQLLNKRRKRSSIPRISQQDREIIKQQVKGEKQIFNDSNRPEKEMSIVANASEDFPLPVNDPSISKCDKHIDNVSKSIVSEVTTEQSSSSHVMPDSNPMRRPMSPRTRPTNKRGLSADDTNIKRAHSFCSDDQFYSKLEELRQRIRANSNPIPFKIPVNLPLSPIDLNRDRDLSFPTFPKPIRNVNTKFSSMSLPRQPKSRQCLLLKDQQQSKVDPGPQSSEYFGVSPVSKFEKNAEIYEYDNALNSNPLQNGKDTPLRCATIDSSAVGSTQLEVKVNLREDNEVTDQSPVTSPAIQVRRSVVPPVRDEEHEIQRKAHAKRVRETRRSTQGITLEDLKSAEELVKKKQYEQRNKEGHLMLGTSPSHTTILSAKATQGTTLHVDNSEAVMKTGQGSVQKEENTRKCSLTEFDEVKDYKKLWEESQLKNASLLLDMNSMRMELETTKQQLNAAQAVSETSSCSELEEEKKVLESNEAEMKEKLQILDQLKADNLRLREENGALIRVISKLSK